ncbi:MAG: efflux transporter outer membrane subunit [Candidatus Latescibacteria bacterium]|nr:efflux transporter outer membrane subunit [Candidatus Latescibacterota bacterium]
MARNAPIVLIGIALTVLLACSPKSTNLSLPLQTPETFSNTSAHPLSEHWWTDFGNANMDSLVNRALQSNFNLETAWQRLRAAQALVSGESAARFPDLNVRLGGEVERPKSPGDEKLRLGITSEYEIDLWGRISSGIAAQHYRAKATHADYQTAALSLSAEVVRTYFQLTSAQNRLALFNHQIETNQKVLSLIKARFGSGQTRSVDILRQKQLIESTREQKIITESRIQVLEHQLAVLLGRPPKAKIAYTPLSLPDLPPIPDAGLPAELIQRRPDVQKAYNILQAADRELAVALSNRYPRLTLTASGSSTSNNISGLFEDWTSNFAGNLLAPIFDGGQRRAEVKRNEAIKSEQLYSYGQKVLTAFQEVENALIQEKKQSEQIASIEAQVTLVRQTYDQLRIEYLNGLSDYLDVLTALTNEQRLQRDLISAKLELLEFRVALYRALAGGFKTDRETNNN